jgi:linoleate 10R-lipoxygenase
MFAFATLVIHRYVQTQKVALIHVDAVYLHLSIFRTSHTDPNINETSSYVDLAPLYGNTQEMQDKVRLRDGKGLLHPDVFAEDRLLLLPPAVCAILVLFNRNHNVCYSRVLFCYPHLNGF